MSETRTIEQVRRELLVMLKVVYPASLSADVLFRALLGAFPRMEREYLRKDLAYLSEKGYVTWQPLSGAAALGGDEGRRRAYRLTPSGVERVDLCPQQMTAEG
ncbi:MAG: hypothetical protein JXQ73_16835 [Phycisphaerae bacterium]|nr:hypothetical protein [Phycisphaerae bacterium]